MPSFITLTLVANAAAVIILPLLCGSLWIITSSKTYIGIKYKNNIYENITLLILFILSLWGSYQTIFVIRDIIIYLIITAVASISSIASSSIKSLPSSSCGI